MSKFFKNIDILSPRPQLTTLDGARHKTILGGFLTALSTITVLIISAYFTIETFQRKTVIILYNEEVNDSPTVDLLDYPFKMGMLNYTGGSIENLDRIVQPVALYSAFSKDKVPQIELLPLTLCSNKTYGNFSDLLSDDNDPNKKAMYCIDTSSLKRNLRLNGTFGQLTSQFMAFTFSKCANNTLYGKTNCLPSAQIDAALVDSFVFINYIDYSIDNYNVSSPKRSYMNGIPLSTSPTLSKKYTIKYREINYETDLGFIFQDLNKQSFHMVETFNEQVAQFPGSYELAQFIITNSIIKGTYKRRYLKIQDLLANIGGVIKGIFVVSYLLENYLVRHVVTLNIIKKIFYVDGEDDHILKYNINDSKIQNEYNAIRSVLPLNVSIFKQKLPLNLSNSNADLVNKYNVKNQNKKKIEISCFEYICSSALLRRNKNLKILDKVNTYLNKKISLCYLVNKLNEVDMMKYIIFNEDELTAFKFMKKFDVDIFSNNENIKLKKSVWGPTGFSEDINDQDMNKFINISKKINLSTYEAKILSLC